MIAPPGLSQAQWQSPDGLMATGTAQLNGISYAYANLGPRPVELADLQALIQHVKTISQRCPLLLLSNCPGLALSYSQEAQGLVFYAGAYRALQQKHKAKGGLILSYVEDIAVGGVYLMHGLSAQHRAAHEHTKFHDTIPAQPTVSLSLAQERGLLDEILPTGALEGWLAVKLCTKLTEAEP